MTLIDSRTAAYWPLDEQADSVLPKDHGGKTAAIAVPIGLTRPPVVQGTIGGYGREFSRAGLTGLRVSDSNGALNLTRGVTVAAILRLDVAQLSDGNVCAVAQRGGVFGAIQFQLLLTAESVSARRVRVQLAWQTVALATIVDAGIAFTWPDGEYLLIAAVREVVNGQFAIRYQVNGESALGEQDHALDCAGVGLDFASLGMAMSGGTFSNHLDGVLDSLHVLTDAVTPEEFDWTWRRMALYQPRAVETARKMVPRGVYSTDPGSSIQRELAVEGRMFGNVKALADRFRNFSLPHRAWGEFLELWEKLTQHSPRPGDHVQRRRERLLSFLGTVRGFAVPDVKAQLAEPFDLDVADIQILEYDNDYSHSAFTADPGNGIATVGNGVIAYTGGELVLSSPSGGATNADLRYGGIGAPRSPSYLWSLGHGDDAWVYGTVRSVDADTGNAAGGIVLGRRAQDEWVFIGLRQSGVGANDLVWWRYKGGVLDATATVIAAAVNYTTAFLRIHHVANGSLLVKHGASDGAAAADAGDVVETGLASPQWAGFFLGAPGNFAVENAEMAFDSIFTHTPKGTQRLSWWAYRNPALAGSPDMDWARLVVRRLRPAHTFGGATTVTQLVCGDSANGCGEGPLGP